MEPVISLFLMFIILLFVMRCEIRQHLYNLKNVKNTHGRVLLLVKHATLLKVTLLHGCFSRFLSFTNGTTSRKASHFTRKESYSSTQFNMTDSFCKNFTKFLYWKFVIIQNATTQFEEVAQNERCRFYGNVNIGTDLKGTDLMKLYDAVVLVSTLATF